MCQSINTNTHWSSDCNKLCELSNCDKLQATKVNARVYGHISLIFTTIANQSQAKPFLTKAAFTAQSTADNNFTLRNPKVRLSLLKKQREQLFSEVNRNFSQSHRFIISSQCVSNNNKFSKKSATTPTTNNKNNEKTKPLHKRHTTTPVSYRQHASMQLWLIATEPRRAYSIFRTWAHCSEFRTEALVFRCVKWNRYT